MGGYTIGYATFSDNNKIVPIDYDTHGRTYEEAVLDEDVYLAVYLVPNEEGGFSEDEIERFVNWGYQMDADRLYDEITGDGYCALVFYDLVALNHFLDAMDDEMEEDKDIETIWPNDPDHTALKKTEGEETISLEEFLRL